MRWQDCEDGYKFPTCCHCCRSPSMEAHSGQIWRRQMILTTTTKSAISARACRTGPSASCTCMVPPTGTQAQVGASNPSRLREDGQTSLAPCVPFLDRCAWSPPRQLGLRPAAHPPGTMGLAQDTACSLSWRCSLLLLTGPTCNTAQPRRNQLSCGVSALR